MIKKINRILEKKQIISFIFLAILLFVGGLFDLLGVSMILPISNLVMEPETLMGEEWAVLICDIFNIYSSRSLVIFLLMLMIVVYIVKNIYIIFMYKILYHYTYSFKRELSLRLFRCYIFQDYTFHLNNNVADLQRNILIDTGQFFGFISDFLNLFNQCVVCLLLGIYLVAVDWQTTIGVVILLCSAMLVFYKFQHKNQIERGNENRDANAEMNKWIIQSFTGIKEIQVLGREQFFINRCEKEYDRSMNANKKSNFAAILPKPLMEMITVAGLLTVILIRLLMGAELSKFISTLAVFAVAAFRLLPCFNSISSYLATMFFEKNSVDAIFDDIMEMEKLGNRKQLLRSKNKLSFKKEIEIRELSYRYPETTKLILRDVSFVIKKNQSVGFMGTSGAGKSTLIDIILGVLPISQGSILVDGKDIRDNMCGWHNIIGYIPQSIYLMDDTIRNNVAFGIPEKEISDEQLWKALEEAQIADFVHSLPEGLNSEIGDRGVRISGGQRQRLGIARALYHDPQVLVFDEATSALDNDTEAALMEAINGLKGSRTMLIIAHRLHTIENCDVIYEVENGKVFENKKH